MKRLIHQDILGMARVGYSGDYEVYVNTNDGGNIPHFHYRDKTNWSEFHTCICLDTPTYFHHNGKEDVLNSSQRKELCRFLSSEPSLQKYKGKFDNNWQLVCFLWDLNNSDAIIPDDTIMPDYRQLPTK